SSLVPSLSISDLFGGVGLTIPNVGPHLRITRPDLSSFEVDLSGIGTIQDLLDRINLEAGFEMATISLGGLRLVNDRPDLGVLDIDGLNGFDVSSLFGLPSLDFPGEFIGPDLNPLASINLPGGPYFRLEASDVDLELFGQELRGDFSIEFLKLPDGRQVLRMAAADVELRLGDGSTDFVVVTNGRGNFVLSAAGVAGSLSASVDLSGVPGATFTGTFGLAVNTTNAAVMETFQVGGREVTLELAAGPYLRVEGLGVTMSILGQTVSGDFAFERVARQGGGQTVRVAASNVSFEFTDGSSPLLSLTQGRGSFLIQGGATVANRGLAGEISGTVAVSVPGVSLSGSLTLQINDTPNAIDETFLVGEERVGLVLPAGRYLRIAGAGVQATILGQRLSGDFEIERATTTGAMPKTVTRVAVANATLALGDGTNDLLSVSGASAYFILSGAGLAGSFTGTITLNVPDVTFGGTFTVEINNTGVAVNETFPTGALTLAAGNFVRVKGTGLTLNVFGQTLTGNFAIDQSMTSDGQKVVRISTRDVTLNLTSGSTTVLSVNDGDGAFILTSQGVAGQLSARLASSAISGVALSSTLGIRINTNMAPVAEAFADGADTIELNLPAGPYLQVTAFDTDVTVSGTVLHGDFLFEQATRNDGAKITRLGVANVSLTVSGNGLRNAEGAFVIFQQGLAGVLSGEIAVAAGGVSVGGRAGFRVNTTGLEVDETIVVNGRSILVKFGAGEVSGFSFFAESLSLNIANFVTIEGSVTFSNVGGKSVFGGTNLSVFLGEGPARLENGDINPLATGVLLSNARIGLIKFANGTFAMVAEGTVQLLGVDGVTLAGTARIRVNNSGAMVDETIEIPNSNQPPVEIEFVNGDLVTRFEALDAELSLLGQTLRGNFSFDKVTSGSLAGTIRIAATDVSLGLGDGTTELISVTNGEGSLLFTSAGLAGSLAADIDTNIPGVEFNGHLSLAINTTGAAVNSVFAVGDETITLELPAGPYLRIEVGPTAPMTPATLEIAGQTLTGRFALEQATSLATGGKVIRLAATDVTLTLRAGSTDLVSLTDGEGILVITAAGVAGRISGTINIESMPGGGEFTGSFSLAINNTRAQVSEMLAVGNTTLHLNLPAGPYVRVQGVGARLSLLGQTLSGDFAFEQTKSAGLDGALGTMDDVSVIRVGAANVTISLGGAVNVTNGTGFFLVTPTGLAGTISANIGFNVPGVTFGGAFRLLVNNSMAEVDETFTVGVLPVSLKLPMGRYLKVEGTGVSLTVLGQTLSGDFSFEQLILAGGASVTRVAASNVTLSLGGTPPAVSLSRGRGQFVVTAAGLAGELSASVSINVPGVRFSGAIKVRVNNTMAAVNETFAGAMLDPLMLPAGPYLRVEIGESAPMTPATLEVLGQTISGNFVLEQVTRPGGTKVVRVAVSDAALGLGGTTGSPIVNLTEGEGFFILASGGIAGRFSGAVEVNVSAVAFAGAFSVEINNTGAAVNDTIQVGGGTLSLSLPAGPFLRVTGTGVRLSVAGQTLTGNFSFEQFTKTAGMTTEKIIRVAATEVSLSLGDGANPLLRVTNGTGFFVIRSTGIAGSLSASVSLNVPEVSLSGTLSVKINNTGAQVNETFTIAGATTVLDLPGGASYVRVEGIGLHLGVLGQTLRGDFAFEQTTTQAPSSQRVVRVSASNVNLALGDGTRDFVRVIDGGGNFLLTAEGVAGEFMGDVVLDVPGVSFEGSFLVRFKTINGTVDETFTTPSGTAHLEFTEMGEFLRIDGTASLNVVGQQVGGTFSIEQATRPGANGMFGDVDDEKVVTIGITDLTLTITDGATDFVTVTDGTGALRIDRLGVAAQFTITDFTLDIPGIDVMASEIELQINTSPAPVDEQVKVGNQTIPLKLPAGSFIRVAVIDVDVQIGGGGPVLHGDFFFDQGDKKEFGPAQDLAGLGAATAVVAGDVNGDGRADLIVGRNGATNLLYLNNGTAKPFDAVTGVAIDATAYNTTSLALADLNGDNKPDLIVGNNDTAGDEENLIYLNNGTANPFNGVTALELDGTAHATTALAVADFNGDNKLDIVVGNDGEPNLLYLSNGTNNPFNGVTALEIDSTARPTTALAVGDLDGDGRPDLVVGFHLAATRIYLNRADDATPGANPFNPAAVLVVGAATDATTAVALGDLDRDGDLDLVTGRTGQTNQIYLSDGTVDPFASATAIDLDAATFTTTALALGDVNGDGKLDVIVANDGAAKRIYLNAFVSADVEENPFAGVTATLVGAGTDATTAVALVDFDGDGDLDLAAANDAQAARVLLNGIKVTRFAVTNVSVEIGGQKLKNGEGAFVIRGGGLAGFMTGEAEIGGGGFSAGGSIGFRINTTGGAVNETLELNGKTLTISFTGNVAAEFFGSDVSLNIGNFVSVYAESFSFTMGRFTGTGVTLFLGQGPLFNDPATGERNPSARGVALLNAGVDIRELAASQYAIFAEGEIELVGIDGVTFTGKARVRVNQDTVNPITLTLPDMTSETLDPGEQRFEGVGLTLEVAGQSIGGTFSFEQLTLPGPNGTPGDADDLRVVKVGVSDAHLGLGDGTTDFVSLTEGEGGLILSSAGLAGEFSVMVGLNVPGAVDFDGTFRVKLNNTAAAVNEDIMVDGA
ncbi:MAG TPA: VCBS repeat-containing protein, partial [Methylomirabilota bacterium]|nr:VCBS repeat-containing protein [Methylomirabilota bacterium]